MKDEYTISLVRTRYSFINYRSIHFIICSNMISMMSRNQTKEKRTKKHCFNIYIMCSVKVIILYTMMKTMTRGNMHGIVLLIYIMCLEKKEKKKNKSNRFTKRRRRRELKTNLSTKTQGYIIELKLYIFSPSGLNNKLYI